MKYNELNIVANKKRKRVGRGISAGGGKTAGRGTKGQGSRSGKKIRSTFTGNSGVRGSNLMSALPKLRGFKSKRAPAQVVYADQLNDIKGAKIDNFILFKAGLITTPYSAVKIIARDELTSKANVQVAGMSESVVEALVKNGGSFTKTPVPLQPSTKTDEESDK